MTEATSEIELAAQPPAAAGGGIDRIFQADKIQFAQTKKGCLQELMGCEANTEFKIIANGAHIATAEEQTSCPMRFFCKGARPFKMVVQEGQEVQKDATDGPLVLERPFRLAVAGCKCCCFQEITAHAGAGGPVVGKVLEKFFCCVPLFEVQDASGAPKYEVQMPTCLGGMCVNCMKEGCCNCKIPFYIYEPGKRGDGEEKGKIVKIWKGIGQELFTDADTFEFEAPPGANTQDKAALFAATILLNQVFFESSQGGGAAPSPETMER